MFFVKRYFNKIIILFAVFVFLAVSFGGFSYAQGTDAAERALLEKEYANLVEQIDNLTNVMQTTQKNRTTLERDIFILDSQKQKLKLKIKAYDLQISGLNTNIKKRETSILSLAEEIEREKQFIAELVRQTNEKDSASLVEIVVGNDSFSDFFTEVKSVYDVQDSLHLSLEMIQNTKNKNETEKEQLQGEKEEQLKIKKEKELENSQLSSIKVQKDKILTLTKGEEAKYQSLLKVKKQTAAEIRNRIYRLIGDVELPFGDAVKIAQDAEKMVGIRAALILAILAQESSVDGVIGRNLGQCHYNDQRNNKSGTVMNNSQKSSFLAIMSEMGRDPNTTPVSCPITSDGAYGGAMGPAQFMPTTWWNIENETGYKKRVAALTGNNPPSPFVNIDAFTGTALYLKDAFNSVACVNYAEANKKTLPYQYLQERCTAAKYYAGGNWRAHRLGYGDRVAERAVQYQKDIEAME